MWLRPKLFLSILPLISHLQGCRGLTGKSVYISAKYSSRSFHLYDDMSNKDTKQNYTMFWFDEVNSTMDKARELSSKICGKFFAVGATSQLKGRGTRGRDWISASNNLLLTIAIPRSLVSIPITLLPLRVGSIIGSCMARRVTDPESQLKLKWPNDILINSRKACGVLIEMEGDMLLVGIGCNVLATPTVNAATNSSNASPVIRPATCLAEHNVELASLAASLLAQREQQSAIQCEGDSGNTQNSTKSTGIKSPSITGHTDIVQAIAGNNQGEGVPVQLTLRHGDAHKELGIDICDNLYHWATAQTDTAAQVLEDFSRNMDYSPQRLRDVKDPLLSTVIPTGLNSDGTLKVKYAHNGEESMLMAEYLW